MRRAAGLLLVVVLAGCGLPLPDSVSAPGQVPQERPRAEQVAVLPAGPQPGASPAQIVETFLGAQSSPEGGHAVARSFLTADAAKAWKDDARVQVYDAAQPPSPVQTSDPSVVRVDFRLVATVDEQGVYRRTAPRQVTEPFRVDCSDRRRCRIAALEDGLRITSADLARSYAPRAVHFLAPAALPGRAPDHLLPDLLWLPRTDAARRLVQRVLDGPSTALRGSAATAVPQGTRLLGVRTGADGTVTVDLSREVAALDPGARERLSAQLVWTLRALRPSFTRLRLRAAGEPFEVEGTTAAQSAGAWASYDPERLPARAALRYVAGRRLQVLAASERADDLAGTDAPDLPVDAVAASPDGTLGLTTRRPDGQVEVRTGRTAARSVRRLVGPFSSPTFGSGEQGLFLLDAARFALLPADGPLVRVPVEDLALPLRQVRVSRDGVRVALLAGDGDAPRLFVGRLQRDDDGWRVVQPREVVPGLRTVVDVAWETSTSLVVLATFPLGVLPARVPVDGSGPIVPLAARLPQRVTPLGLAAAGGRPVVLAARDDDRPTAPLALYAETPAGFQRQAPGAEPAYPG